MLQYLVIVSFSLISSLVLGETRSLSGVTVGLAIQDNGTQRSKPPFSYNYVSARNGSGERQYFRIPRINPDGRFSVYGVEFCISSDWFTPCSASTKDFTKSPSTKENFE